MAKVDFYVLDRVDEHSRFVLACKLAEKAWRLDNRIHIQAATSAQAQKLDELLWTFRDGSFVPHDLIENDAAAPITIGSPDSAPAPEPGRDLLISLCDEIPEFAESFPRVAELVTSEENCRQLGRQRFTQYREQGHTMETHKL